MGKYINTGNAGFKRIRNSEYIDKSMLIAAVNSTLFTEQCMSCVSRCRRFGKSMAAKMLCAYYDHSCQSRSLFEDLKIAADPSFEKHLNSYWAATGAYDTVAGYLDTKKATGTDFVLERDWMPLVGVPGSNAPETTFTQTAADSMTWENGKTVRFRAWCRSNLTDAYANGSKERYYPDYMISEWVTVSGPTLDIPLVLKHQGCRIGFTTKAGNQFAKAEIATKLTGRSYIAGCIYEGTAGGAMIGEANNLEMYGNMMVVSGLTSGKGALLGAYSAGTPPFFKPQTGTDVTWARFMVNYYDQDKSEGTNAVGTTAEIYRPQEYIRGAWSWVLKAKNDNLLSDEVPYDKLTDHMKKGYYGLAPWNAHFVNNTTGFDNRYPTLVAGAPDSDADDTGYKGNYESLNVLVSE